MGNSTIPIRSQELSSYVRKGLLRLDEHTRAISTKEGQQLFTLDTEGNAYIDLSGEKIPYIDRGLRAGANVDGKPYFEYLAKHDKAQGTANIIVFHEVAGSTGGHTAFALLPPQDTPSRHSPVEVHMMQDITVGSQLMRVASYNAPYFLAIAANSPDWMEIGLWVGGLVFCVESQISGCLDFLPRFSHKKVAKSFGFDCAIPFSVNRAQSAVITADIALDVLHSTQLNYNKRNYFGQNCTKYSLDILENIGIPATEACGFERGAKHTVSANNILASIHRELPKTSPLVEVYVEGLDDRAIKISHINNNGVNIHVIEGDVTRHNAIYNNTISENENGMALDIVTLLGHAKKRGLEFTQDGWYCGAEKLTTKTHPTRICVDVEKPKAVHPSPEPKEYLSSGSWRKHIEDRRSVQKSPEAERF